MKTYTIESLDSYLPEFKKLDKELSDLLTHYCPRGKYGAFDFYECDTLDDVLQSIKDFAFYRIENL